MERIGHNHNQYLLLIEIVPMSTQSSPEPQTQPHQQPHNSRDHGAPDIVQMPANKELVLKVIPMPADSNVNGDIFGGWVMAQVDLAGSVIPARIAKGRIATVAVNQFVFKQAVKMGDLLSFYAEVERIGTTSVTVKVEVYAQRMRQPEPIIKVTEANLTYVAIDDSGKPRKIEKDQA
jgi:acyl-CoA thioesterase YciA